MHCRQLGTTELKVSTVSPGCRQIEDVVVTRCVRHDVSIICYSPLAQGLPADKWQSTGDVREAQARNRMFSYDRSGTKRNVTVRHVDQSTRQGLVNQLTGVVSHLDCEREFPPALRHLCPCLAKNANDLVTIVLS